MKKLVLAVIALCSSIAACRHEDTNDPNVWVRADEPRLSGRSKWHECRQLPLKLGQLVAQTECGTETRLNDAACPDAGLVITRDEALRVLVTQPHCTDVAIAALSRVSPNDLAAAYYIRAQREDNPSDFVRAAAAAVKAEENPVSLFNRARSFEALGLNGDAIAAWDAFLRLEEKSQWANEARRRRQKLLALDSIDEWERDSAVLRAALRADDRKTIARIVGRYPAAAQKFMEDELLPDDVKGAEKIADELFRLTGDPFARDVVRAFTGTADRGRLNGGHVAYRKARLLDRAFRRQEATGGYKEAAELLRTAGSPLSLVAQLRSGFSLDTIEAEATSHGYTRLAARVRATRGYGKTYDYEYVTALEEYDAALTEYVQIRDREGIASTYTRLSGLYRLMGDAEGAWNHAFQALRHASNQTDAQERHLLLGETAHAALALGYPSIGIRYMNAAIARIRRELTRTPPEHLASLRQLRQNLAIGVRERAVMYLELKQYAIAERDLREAVRLTADGGDDDENRRELLARLRNVEGQALLQSKPAEAEKKFSEAIGAAGSDHFPTFIAALRLQRSEAYRRQGRYEEAAEELKGALSDIRKEETNQLLNRERGERERLWRPYFSRFQDHYALLIKELTAAGHHDDAFIYAERARAFELIDLIRQLPSVPALFRDLTANGQTASRQQVQAALQPGTYLLAYTVLEDRTYTWIISRNSFEVVRMNTTRAHVERWATSLSSAAAKRDEKTFKKALLPPYDGLIALPLSVVRRMARDTLVRRIVIVPDGAMSALPFSALRGYDTPYFIEEAPLATAGSATLYLYSLVRDSAMKVEHPTGLLVGDPAFDSHLQFAAGMQRLPNAAQEALEIQQVYGSGYDLLLGEEATAEAFLSRARTKTIVHVAAHARPNAGEPWRSLIFFARSAQDTGVLDAEELLEKLTLDQTKLVVLAACSSAGGLPVGPEGVGPLVRPLIAAGVPAVVGTLWDVDDATAKGLMVSFHRHYREGRDVTVALQMAQLEALKDKSVGRNSPLVWAPFQVIGHADSPFEATHQK